MTGTAATIVRLCTQRGLSVTTAESCTAGLVSAALTAIPGSSAMFQRGFVTYSNEAKADMLGVSPATLDAHGAVSEEVAGEMAQGARQAARADVAVSISGIAGPGGSEHKPEGRVCFGVATAAGVKTLTRDFGPLGRDAVRRESVVQALDLIANAIDG